MGMKTDLFQSCGHCWVVQITLVDMDNCTLEICIYTGISKALQDRHWFNCVWCSISQTYLTSKTPLLPFSITPIDILQEIAVWKVLYWAIDWKWLSTTNWHLPSTSTRIKWCAYAAADFQHPLKWGRGGQQKQGPLCMGEKLVGQLFRELGNFRSWLLWTQFLYLSISRKTLKSFIVMAVSHD